MTLFHISAATYTKLPDRARYLPTGTWINKPTVEVDANEKPTGFLLIEDDALTFGDQIVLEEVAKDPRKLASLPVGEVLAREERKEQSERTRADLLAWRLDTLTKYPDAVVKIEAEPLDDPGNVRPPKGNIRPVRR